MTSVRFNGNWTKVTASLAALPTVLQSAAIWGQRKAAEKLVKIVKGHINNQDLNWPQPNNKSNSGDPRILVDSEAYLNSIKAWKKGDTYYAGIPSTARNAKGIRIADYAILHEFGYDDMPERALWRPSVEELGGGQGIAAIIGAAIYNKIGALRAAGFTVTNKL